MNTSNLVKLLEEIGLEKIKVINDNVMFLCPFHGEVNNPSAGIKIDGLYGACFSCNQGFTLLSLVMHTKQCSFKKACDLIDDYGGSIREEVSSRKILRYGEAEETAEKMPVLPSHRLAVYGSGKKFHKYILERFPKDICRKFMIGWDEEILRITIPIFNREDGLLGFIRRAVLNPKISGETNPEYEKVYGNQPKYLIDSCIVKSHVLYPLNHFILPQDRTVILCEGQCFRGDTEILTKEEGWITFGKYTNQTVMQVNDSFNGEFVKPLAYIKKPFNGELLYVERGGNYESLTTPNHNIVYVDVKNRIIKREAQDMPKNIIGKIPTAITHNGDGIGLTKDQIALCIAVSADATIDIRKNTRQKAKEKRYARSAFKKQRKVDRLRNILESLGMEYSCTSISGGYTSICFPLPDWCVGRFFPMDWIWKSTLEEKQFIISEMVYWDGNFVKGRNQTEYVSKYYENAKFIQTIAHTCGIMSTIMKKEDSLGLRYKVSVLHTKNSVSWQGITPKKIPHNGYVYCVSVPSRMILVRHNGRISVSGNCDSIRMHQHGFTNTLSIINSKINQPQIDILKMMGVRNIINFLDPDEAGKTGGEKLQKLCRKDFTVYNVKWVDGVSDPDGLTKEQAEHMIANKFMYQLGRLKRI